MKKSYEKFTITAAHSGTVYQGDTEVLRRKAVEFLGYLATEALTDTRFFTLIGKGGGDEKLKRLVGGCGFGKDYPLFFKTLMAKIFEEKEPVREVGGVELPTRFLVALLEEVIPRSGYVSVKNVDQLIGATNLYVDGKDREALQEVIGTYPVRLSYHTIRQMMVSRDVAYQYMPFVEELDRVGHTNTWIGQFHQGLLEQMYQNRVIFLLNMSCPVYCRFCFRKHKDSRDEENPTVEDVNRAIAHVAQSPTVKEVVVTGGDPFMGRKNMQASIDGLMDIPHVQSLRLATRSVAYYPELFLGDDEAYLKYLKQKNLELQRKGKRMEIATHFIHPDEVSPQALYLIREFVSSGIAVYIQTPFLQDCNDRGPELKKLFGLLRGAGAEMHYIYIPCSPIHGNSVYWSPLSDGIDIAEYLRAYLSDRSVPKICTATPIGKMEWYTSGWAVEPVEGKDNFLWIRTPYTPDYFKSFAPLAKDLPNIRVNEEGTLDIQFMARIGKESYFLGSRPLRLVKKEQPLPLPEHLKLPELAPLLRGDSIVDTGSPHIRRVHCTRVEITTGAGEKALDYIRAHPAITDVVVVPEGRLLDSLCFLDGMARALEEIPHVNALRLRAVEFNTAPAAFSDSIAIRLGEMNRLDVANPLRVEIEGWFLLPGEIAESHERLTRKLNNKGITVYCNTPLLGGINDNQDTIQEMTFKYRKAGIEFHHLYVAGLKGQAEWNRAHPVDMYDVVDIASKIRREGSGREGPRYIIQTPLGEVYYGLTSSFSFDGGRVVMTMDSYHQEYYLEMDKDFALPEGIEFTEDNKPRMAVPGLASSTGFPL